MGSSGSKSEKVLGTPFLDKERYFGLENVCLASLHVVPSGKVDMSARRQVKHRSHNPSFGDRGCKLSLEIETSRSWNASDEICYHKHHDECHHGHLHY